MHRLDAPLQTLRACFVGFPDARRGANVTYTTAEIGLAAFSAFFVQSPSFLAHQRRLHEGQGRSNLTPLFGLTRVPGDNHIRAMLDPADPALLHPAFDAASADLDASGGLAAFRHLGGRVPIALDGTEYSRSTRIGRPNRSTRRRGNGATERYHAMLGATLVAPGHAHATPLPPEFIAPQDGAEKRDCESRAARRWLAAHGPRYARLKPVYLGDDPFARRPMCEAVQGAGGNFLFVRKPASHPLIEEYLAGVEAPAHSVRVKRGRGHVAHRYRWMAGVPLRDGGGALAVNWLEIEIRTARGEVTYRNSFVTDLPVNRDTVAELAACGRARWKIENEAFDVLKTGGVVTGANSRAARLR